MFRRVLLVIIFVWATVSVCRAQFADCSTGLLQMPTAEMQEDGTFFITNNFLNKHSLATSGWNYNTFQYGVGVSFWGRVEMSYVCTIFNDHWKGSQSRKDVWMVNQDRHFTGRICLLREGDFGQKWIPALVIGVSDPLTGGSTDYFTPHKVDGLDNGFFNRNFLVLSKHFKTPWGLLGAHAGYQFNYRADYFINAPCAGINWQPKWLQQRGILDRLDVIAEYDSRTVNLGVIASVWESRFDAMFEIQSFKWINLGLRYKFQIRKI